MKKFKKTAGVFGGRFAATISILAISLLVGCGGGGGSSPATGGSVITPPANVLSIIASAPVVSNISVAGTQATAGLSAEFTPVNFVNPTAASFTSSTGTSATFTCGGVSVSKDVLVPIFAITQVAGTPRFVATSSFSATGLPASSNCIFSLPLSIAGNGAVSSPVTISFSFMTTAVYKYARFNMVVFADKGGYVGKIDDATGAVTPLINGSEFTTGAFAPLALCGIYDKLLDDGRPLITCTTPASGNTRRNFLVDPITGTVMPEYKGAVSAGAVARDVGYGTFGDTPYASFGVGLKGRYIDVIGVGTYFITNADSVNLRKTTDNFKTSTVINVGDHKFLATFSNP